MLQNELIIQRPKFIFVIISSQAQREDIKNLRGATIFMKCGVSGQGSFMVSVEMEQQNLKQTKKKKKKIADVKEMALNHQVRVQEYGDQEILTLNRHVSLQGNLKLRTAGILKKVRSSQTAHLRSQQQYSPQQPLS